MSTYRRQIFFKKMGLPRPLFHLFLSFQTQITTLQQINVQNCPSSIQCQDSNSQPLEHESPPITTRPGLPPYGGNLLCEKFNAKDIL